jgi:hypothetical protein
MQMKLFKTTDQLEGDGRGGERENAIEKSRDNFAALIGSRSRIEERSSPSAATATSPGFASIMSSGTLALRVAIIFTKAIAAFRLSLALAHTMYVPLAPSLPLSLSFDFIFDKKFPNSFYNTICAYDIYTLRRDLPIILDLIIPKIRVSAFLQNKFDFLITYSLRDFILVMNAALKNGTINVFR